MNSVGHRLERTFWSLYGRFVWDGPEALGKVSRVRQIVGLVEARRTADGERVLDAGCGTGNYSLGLARAGFDVVGLDYAKGMIARARSKVPDGMTHAVSFQQADLNGRLEFPDAHFDHVLSISVLQVLADPIFSLRELWRVLKPGGTFVLLHIPKSDVHSLPLREAVRIRTRALGKQAPWRVGLIAAKLCAERTGKARYWTVPELCEMLRVTRFTIHSLEQGPPIILVAQRRRGS
jgi:ubiquinone/menaquinone biosynthesis C-methylase UbiE